MARAEHLKNLIALRPAAIRSDENELMPIGLLQILIFIYFIRNKFRFPNPDILLTSDHPDCELTGKAIKQIINNGNDIELHSTALLANNIFDGSSIDYMIKQNFWDDKKFIIAILEDRAFENYTIGAKWHRREMFSPMNGIFFQAENWDDMKNPMGHNNGRWKLSAPELNFAYINRHYSFMYNQLLGEDKRLQKSKHLWNYFDDQMKFHDEQSQFQEMRIKSLTDFLKTNAQFKTLLSHDFYKFEH